MKREKGEARSKRTIKELVARCDRDGYLTSDLGFSLEMISNSNLVLYGCRKILKYTASEMVFRAKSFDIAIGGEDLFCAVYHIDGVEITGKIEEIRFICEGKK